MPKPRDASSTLKVIIIGAGLGGLAASISIRLAGHEVTVLESAREISEVGAGIQCLPNSTKILRAWDTHGHLDSKASTTQTCNILSWKGGQISRMDFARAGTELGAPFHDFHRADLHAFLLGRATELGAEVFTDSEVTDVKFHHESTATVYIKGEEARTADLVVGADGINSRTREILLGLPEPPHRTGDMAYRILLDAKDIRKTGDPGLTKYLDEKAVNYWYGPGAHVVTYPLRDATQLNLVLLVPDNMPEEGPSTLQGYVNEMQGLFRDWDPNIGKLLSLCPSVLRWRLCIRNPLETWVHPSQALVLLGDSAHATLPYLASGAGMTFEDAAVLGECLARLESRSQAERKKALAVYEHCRKQRTETVVARGSIQQDLNHLNDGVEQEDRDAKMRAFEDVERDWAAGNRGPLPSGLREGEDPLVWRRYGVGGWLFSYDAAEDVEEKWAAAAFDQNAHAPRPSL
ncbi:uncharacterized protein DSM5745_11147 [Aspergillus mulundensis]|uniref:FAD-binding domain-containing protein n=1 Tax=Aspergillus mulundensis TaxID=1810919 RepID=A0A3D8QB03_9EURO|nr:Uncharacterized protein DSM5745_11147 [Aspergillus mulundensis]RDW58941.1 Uncharacterized protein DSM5745_11147 [Aspergillus mulundensis]